jgi:hypothetical protein
VAGTGDGGFGVEENGERFGDFLKCKSFAQGLGQVLREQTPGDFFVNDCI